MARVVLEGEWTVGVGLSRWEELQLVGLLPSHFAHSQILLMLFSGGVVGLALFTWLMAELLRVTSVQQIRHAAPTLAVLISGLTEAVWNPLTIDGLTWVTVVVLLTAIPPSDQQLEAKESTPETRRRRSDKQPA